MEEIEGGKRSQYEGFDLIVSHRWGMFRRAREEIAEILAELGDPAPVVEKTCARGITVVRTTLYAREVIARARAMYDSDPSTIRFTIKWLPADVWCGTGLQELKEALRGQLSRIKKGERWGMKVKKRRYTGLHSIEIIEELAALVDEKVDLENPDKIVRVELIGADACVTIMRPEEVFSTGL